MTKEEILQKVTYDLELRGRSIETIREYTSKTRLFQDHYGKPADQMGEAEIIEYLHHLLAVKKIHPNSVNTYNSALRFLYGITLEVVLNHKKLPRLKQTRRIPQIFTKEEVAKILGGAETLIHKAMLMLAYGSGLRLSEITHLKVSDIESSQIRILIRQRKDITHIAVKSSNDETVLLNFDVAAKSYDHKKYRYFGEDNNKYLFLDVWEVTQGQINLIDGHIDSYIIYFTDSGVTYEKTPDNAVPLLIKDGWLYAYSKLQFLKIDMETKQQEVLHKLPFEGEFPPYTPRHNNELPEYPNLCHSYEFIISTDQIVFQGDVYGSGETIVFCTVDI